MADLNVKVGLDQSGFQTGLAAMENDATKFGQTIGKISPGNFAGAFKNIAADLANAQTPAEAFSSVISNLSNLLRGTIAGAAGLGIGKVLAAPFTELSSIVQNSVTSAKSALDSLEGAGPALSFEDAVAQAQSLDQAIAQIQGSINQIDSSPLLKIADSFIGAKQELELLQQSLQNAKASSIAEGAFLSANEAEAAVGATPEEKQRLRIKQDAERERQKIRQEFEGTYLNPESAIADVDRKEKAKLADLDLKEAEKRAKALAELEAGAREVERQKRKRKDDEEHAEAMKRAKELIDQIDEKNKERQDGPTVEQKEAQETKDRGERLQEMNRLRGNAPDFDPREALINRMQGMGSAMTPAALQDTVKNTTVQGIDGKIGTVIGKLDALISAAGRFG